MCLNVYTVIQRGTHVTQMPYFRPSASFALAFIRCRYENQLLQTACICLYLIKL